MLPAGRRLLVSFGLVALVVWGWHPARVAADALLLLPAMFPAAAVDPLGLAPAPVVESSTYPYAGGTVDAQLFIPATGGRHGAIVLLLGAGDLPRSDLAVRFAEALARLGIVTLVPEPSGMLAERLTFDEVDALRASLDLLQSRADVDVGRVGFVGLSASGGLGIVAAGQPDLRGRVHFVNSFGSYADTLALLSDVASRSLVVDGQQRDWQPEQRTLEVVANALEDAGVDADTQAALVGGVSREQADALLAQLPSSSMQKLARLSPVDYLRDLSAHIYLMHDQDDPFIPFTQSRALNAAAPAGVVERFTEFSIFSHVIPDRPVPWQTFLPDLWRLFWHVHAVLLEVL